MTRFPNTCFLWSAYKVDSHWCSMGWFQSLWVFQWYLFLQITINFVRASHLSMASQGFLLCRFSVLWICGFGVYFKSGIVHVSNVKDNVEDRAGLLFRSSLLPNYLLTGSNKWMFCLGFEHYRHPSVSEQLRNWGSVPLNSKGQVTKEKQLQES